MFLEKSMGIQSDRVDLSKQEEMAGYIHTLKKAHRERERILTEALAASVAMTVLNGRTDVVPAEETRRHLVRILRMSGSSADRHIIERYL